MTTYRAGLNEIEAGLGPRRNERWQSPHSHEWFVLDWNAQRLAVHDHDIDAIIRTHAKDRRVAAWLEDTAEAFEEIGDIDLAIDWAKQAADFDQGHQSLKGAKYWYPLPEAHRRARCWMRGSSRSAAGRPRQRRPDFTRRRERHGTATATR